MWCAFTRVVFFLRGRAGSQLSTVTFYLKPTCNFRCKRVRPTFRSALRAVCGLHWSVRMAYGSAVCGGGRGIALNLRFYHGFTVSSGHVHPLFMHVFLCLYAAPAALELQIPNHPQRIPPMPGTSRKSDACARAMSAREFRSPFRSGRRAGLSAWRDRGMPA